MILPRISRLFEVCGKYSLQPSRNASILKALNSNPVLVSTNKDVYTNLALEHWLFTNIKFVGKDSSNADQDARTFSHPIVFIWIDEPSIVIGRHQNPWVETTLGLIKKLGIKLARRQSGGGCVYHDEGNINISIIGHRDLFENRQTNLRFLADTLRTNYDVECEPNKRHDLIHSKSGLKISGSAAKLGKTNCYHHFTLLVETDKEIMLAAIRQNQQNFIKTNSSLSSRSSVINLKELNSSLTVDQVISDVSQAYGRKYSRPKQAHLTCNERFDSDENPEFDSLNKIKEKLANPDWIFGMTPKFKLEQNIELMDDGVKKVGKLIVQINRGKFEKIDIECGLKNFDSSEKFLPLIGTEFTYEDAMVNVVKMLQPGKSYAQADGQLCNLDASEQIFATHLLKMIQDTHF